MAKDARQREVIPFPRRPRSGTRELYEGRVSAENQGRYEIDRVFKARQALSCVIKPEKGDRVIYSGEKDEFFILHILERAAAAARLALPETEELSVHCRRLRFFAQEELALTSLKSLSLTSCLDALRLQCRNWFVHVAESLVQYAQHQICRAREYNLETENLLRQHGRHQVITAEQDVKIDGERISMG